VKIILLLLINEDYILTQWANPVPEGGWNWKWRQKKLNTDLWFNDSRVGGRNGV